MKNNYIKTNPAGELGESLKTKLNETNEEKSKPFTGEFLAKNRS